MGSSRREVELEEQLKEAGNMLLTPPSDVDELNNLLDRVEHLLSYVEQAPPISMQDALLPLMKAFKANQLLRHPNTDVRVSVASCLSEITRITAPESPYDDQLMKEIFKLTIETFKKLSDVSGRCYSRAVSILDTAAKVRSCLVMLDLECDSLVSQMFQIFLESIRSDHPRAVFSAMETIMTLVLEESEDVSSDLFGILLDSVRKENQDFSPISYKLGENVITSCAAKLKPNLIKAVDARGIHLDEYAEIVGTISETVYENLRRENLISAGENTANKEHNPVSAEDTCDDLDGFPKSTTSNGTTPTGSKDSFKINNSSKNNDVEGCAEPENVDSVTPVKLETESENSLKKRGRKRNSLMNPAEGYEWNSAGRKTPKISGSRRSQDKELDLSPSRNSEPTKTVRVCDSASSPFPKDSGHNTSPLKEGERKKKKSKETSRSEDSTSKLKAKYRCDSESRRRKRSTKIGLAVKIKEEISQAQGVSENDGHSLDQPYIEEGNTASVTKKKKRMSEESAKSDRNYSEERKTPKTQAKRNRSTGKEVMSPIQDSKVSGLGEQLIGSKIKVWWPIDKAFYEGVVDAYDPMKKKHKILYTDGDEEVLNLKRERWELIGNLYSAVGGQESDGSKPDGSSDIQQKENKKPNSKSTKEVKADSSSKRQLKKKTIVKTEPPEEAEAKDVSSTKRTKVSGDAPNAKSKKHTNGETGIVESTAGESSANASKTKARKSGGGGSAGANQPMNDESGRSSAKRSKGKIRTSTVDVSKRHGSPKGDDQNSAAKLNITLKSDTDRKETTTTSTGMGDESGGAIRSRENSRNLVLVIKKARKET